MVCRRCRTAATDRKFALEALAVLKKSLDEKFQSTSQSIPMNSRFPERTPFRTKLYNQIRDGPSVRTASEGRRKQAEGEKFSTLAGSLTKRRGQSRRSIRG
jgi:hypothetical protein